MSKGGVEVCILYRGTTWHWCDLTFIELSVVKLNYGKVSTMGMSSCDSALLVSGAAWAVFGFRPVDLGEST